MTVLPPDPSVLDHKAHQFKPFSVQSIHNILQKAQNKGADEQILKAYLDLSSKAYSTFRFQLRLSVHQIQGFFSPTEKARNKGADEQILKAYFDSSAKAYGRFRLKSRISVHQIWGFFWPTEKLWISLGNVGPRKELKSKIRFLRNASERT
ncbi:hypothetical protein SUGI_1095280 [Cryptomeria japonica]|nr:hypothetical protein SUGI_1095280 [Cryptomeria japonica]